MFEIIPPNTNVDFLGWRRTAMIVSAVLLIISAGLLVIRGPQLGIDFAGGSLVHVRFAAPKQTDEVRAALSEAGFENLDIQDLGRDGGEFLIRLPLEGDGTEEVSQRVVGTLKERFGADQVDVLRIEAVGPRVGEALRGKAVLAVALATLMMAVYIWLRFEWRFGVGTAIAILHDVLIVVGFLIIFGYEFDLNIIASLLTVMGFSVNDKVVVSDRIRESRRKDRRSPLAVVINRSVNETLSRTILTNGTAFIAVLSLYLLGGSVIHGFAFALVVGSIIGTYSSIFVVSPIVLFFEPSGAAAATPERRERRVPTTSAARRR
ncbi:MAG: protein translocase subunit SecF [Candidatus Binatia bacterium]